MNDTEYENNLEDELRLRHWGETLPKIHGAPHVARRSMSVDCTNGAPCSGCDEVIVSGDATEAE